MLASMTKSDGWPLASSITSGERHLANTAPACLYSVSRAARESRPCITVEPRWPGSAYTCVTPPSRGRATVRSHH
eukprot:361401-Chlamydomonas_euryale.AAC.6